MPHASLDVLLSHDGRSHQSPGLIVWSEKSGRQTCIGIYKIFRKKHILRIADIFASVQFSPVFAVLCVQRKKHTPLPTAPGVFGKCLDSIQDTCKA